MRCPSFTTKALPSIGAGMVLAMVMIMSMIPHYSREVPASEGNFAPLLPPAPARLLSAGVARATPASSVRTTATKRPKLPINKISAPAKPNRTKLPQITVTKSSPAPTFDRSAPKSKWRFLTRSVRAQIDAAVVRAGNWKMIVIHNSGSPTGSARAFDYYHRHVKHMAHGLAYHFVIGNGHGSGNGRVEVGPRWTHQQAGGHLRSETQNEIALGICMVGNFQKSNPSQSQIEALDELIDYLQAKIGKIRVTTHRLVNIRPTLCPGKNFPTGQFVAP